MGNILSYCGLIDARISASEKNSLYATLSLNSTERKIFIAMHCNENEKWEKFRPFPLFDGPKKDLGIWFPDIHSKSAGCIEKGVFSRYFILDYVCTI